MPPILPTPNKVPTVRQIDESIDVFKELIKYIKTNRGSNEPTTYELLGKPLGIYRRNLWAQLGLISDFTRHNTSNKVCISAVVVRVFIQFGFRVVGGGFLEQFMDAYSGGTLFNNSNYLQRIDFYRDNFINTFALGDTVLDDLLNDYITHYIPFLNQLPPKKQRNYYIPVANPKKRGRKSK